jgi:hypothetical protein
MIGRMIRGRRNPLWLVLGPVGIILVLVVVLGGTAVVGMATGMGSRGDTGSTTRGPVMPGGGPNAAWDPGNIFSDAVFYNADALPDVAAVQAALDLVGGSCTASTCLRLDTYATAPTHVDWCKDYAPAGAERYATILFKLAHACGINPQVAIVMIQKESQGLTKGVPPAALTGFGCPDTGPGGSANCDAGSAGVWAQTFGMFQAFARLRVDPTRVNYLEGQTHDILWNVAETGCGSAPVLVQNRATATLYTYTPYQPNAAALAAYPGVGDKCSAYGNRNAFRMFQQWFGDTGGGLPVAAPGGGGAGSVVGGCSDPTLADKVLGNPNLVLRPGREASQTADIRGRLRCNTVAMIASMLTIGVPIRLNSLASDHPVDGGYHPKGMGMDLGYPAGDPTGAIVYEFLYKNRESLHLLQIIWAYPPNIAGIDPGQKCVQQNVNGEAATFGVVGDCDALYPNDISGHTDHIHVAAANLQPSQNGA